jgi:serine/threonine-protein kinase
MIFPIGTMLDRYRIDSILGQGHTGVVYLAFDSAIERTVAIKCLKAATPSKNQENESSRINVLFKEAKVIGQLNHPHIATVFDMGTSNEVPYIVMEYVRGETLKSRLAHMETDKATVPQILSFIVMVARGLHYVHQHGILHGDINPANLIVTPQGTPKIMDFGVARSSLGDGPPKWCLAGDDYVWGTAGYFAPELLTGYEIDARADVFSLGVIAYEWLSGHKPFRADTLEIARKSVVQGNLKPLSELGDFDLELSKEIDMALARDPAKRFSSADAMADALEICQEQLLKKHPSEFIQAPPDQRPPKALPHLKGRNVLFADFSEEELSSVMQMSRREKYNEGETIVQQGAGGSMMYLVVKGRVSIRKTSEEKEIEIKQAGSGEWFGEMAVISQMPRSASVVALRSTEVLALSGAVLRSASPFLSMKLYRNIASHLSERIRERDEEMLSLLQNNGKKRPEKRRFSFW